MMIYLENLRKHRLKHKYTYQDMGNFLKISKTYYWQIEHKQRRLSYDMAIKIASIFKTTPDKLFYKDIKK